MTKKDEVATLENIHVEAIRYGITVTPEEEEVRFASIKGSVGKDGADPVYLVFYNDKAVEVTNDLRAVLKANGKDTEAFPTDPSPEANQLVTGLSDKDLRLTVFDAKLRKSRSGAIYKGGDFEVDLSSAPLLKEAREKIEVARKALSDLEQSYVDMLNQVFDGTVDASKVEAPEIEESKDATPAAAEEANVSEADLASDQEDSPEVAQDEVDNTADASPEETPSNGEDEPVAAEEEVADAPKADVPEVEEKSGSEAKEADDAEKATFGDEPDDGVEPKEVSLDLDDEDNKATASNKDDQDNSNEAEASAGDPEDDKPKAKVTPKVALKKPRIRLGARPGASGPRP